jgi:hypothetical protein
MKETKSLTVVGISYLVIFISGYVVGHAMSRSSLTQAKIDNMRKRHSYIESNSNGLKLKSNRHETWIGDSMLIETDTTFYNY